MFINELSQNIPDSKEGLRVGHARAREKRLSERMLSTLAEEDITANGSQHVE